jgi:uncharacterized membrane protein
MGEQLILIGFLTVFVGIALIIIGSILTATKSKQTKVEWGFGGFIGPIPFGAASQEDILKLIMIVSLFFFVLFLIFGKGLVRLP